jgi:hypothetical protein
MTQEVIDVGVNADDGSGDSLYKAGGKINNNFGDFFDLVPVKADIKFLGNNITSRQSNADIDVHPSGTGSILFPGIRFNDNNIEAVRTNDDLRISAGAGGSVIIGGIGFDAGTTISATDSSSVNINENLIVDGSLSATGNFAFGTTKAFVTGSTFGTLTLANGSITDSSGAISFGNENLTTTGTLSAETGSSLGNLTLGDGSITDSSGAISFGNENLTSTGTVNGATGSTFGNLTLANGSITDSSGAISFGNENLTTSGTYKPGTLTMAAGSITDSSGAISFGNENLTTTGTLTVGGATTMVNMSVSGATSFAAPVTVDNLTFNDNIISTSSNADLNLTPGGTGVVNVANLTIDSSINFTDNVIKVTNSNADLVLSGNGSGSVEFNNIDINSGTIDNTIIGANNPGSGVFNPLSFNTLVIPTKITFSGNTVSTNRSNDNLEFAANGTGNVIINGLSLPNADGQTGQFLQTNGSGVLGYLSTGFAMSETDIQDVQTVITFRNLTVIDHVTAVGGHSKIESSASAQDQFATSKYDSAWYLAINRDDVSDEFEIVKHSLAHNNSNAFVSSSGVAKTGTNNHIETSADVNNSRARLLGTGNSGANSMSYYRIGLGDDDSTGYSGEDEAATVINTDIDSASEVFDTWAHADFRGAKYYISVNNASKTEISNLEASVVHDGTAAYVSIYNVVNSGSNDLVTITAAIDGDNVKLSAAGLETNLRLHAYRIILADDEADRSSTNVNVIGEVTVSSASTTLDTFSTNTYQGCHYIIVAHNSSEGASSICEASVVSDGTTAFITQYGMVSTKGTDQLLLTAAHSSTTTTVSAISSSGGSTTVNAYRVNLARGEGSTSAVATLDSFSASTFRSANYFMQIADDSDGKYELQQLNVTHDGTNAFVSVFGSAGTDQDMITVTADINGGNVRLRGTINTTNDHTVTSVRRIINV